MFYILIYVLIHQALLELKLFKACYGYWYNPEGFTTKRIKSYYPCIEEIFSNIKSIFIINILTTFCF